MSTSTLRRIRRRRRDDDEHGDEQRRDRVALREAGARGDEAGEHGDAPDEVGAEVQRVREQRGALEPAGRAVRDATVRATSIAMTTPSAANAHHAGSTSSSIQPREPRDREPGDADRDEHEEAGLRERREVLRLAVAVEVARVGGLRRDADREEREQRGDEVGAGVRGVGDQAEAAGGEPDRRA